MSEKRERKRKKEKNIGIISAPPKVLVSFHIGGQCDQADRCHCIVNADSPKSRHRVERSWHDVGHARNSDVQYAEDQRIQRKGEVRKRERGIPMSIERAHMHYSCISHVFPP